MVMKFARSIFREQIIEETARMAVSTRKTTKKKRKRFLIRSLLSILIHSSWLLIKVLLSLVTLATLL
jgi:uncharacterized membrane protein